MVRNICTRAQNMGRKERESDGGGERGEGEGEDGEESARGGRGAGGRTVC